MTAAIPRPTGLAPDPVGATGPDPAEPLGPLATFLASAYLTLAMVLAAPAYPLEPWVWTITLGIPFGALFLAPRAQLRRIVFDGPVLAMTAWIALSVLWTRNPSFGVFTIRRDVPLIIAVSMMASLLDRDTAIRAFRRGLLAGILITVFALIFVPETRSHAADGIYLQSYPGWHGYFIHKNTLAPYLVIALITTLVWESDAIRRGALLGVIAVLLVGSDSATGMSAAIFVVLLWTWFRFYHRSDGRWTTGYVVATIAVGLTGLMAAFASLELLASAYGKDLTFSGRTYIWTAVIHAIEEEPVVGYGIGGVFWDTRSEITRTIFREVGFGIPHSHSGALDVALNYGLIGLALFTVVFVTTAAMGIRLLRRSPQLAEWVLMLVAVQFVMGLSENVFLGSWLVYMTIVRGIARRELNHADRTERFELLEQAGDAEEPGTVLDLDSPHEAVQ